MIVVRERQKRPIDAGKPKGTGVDYYFLNPCRVRETAVEREPFRSRGLDQGHTCVRARLLGTAVGQACAFRSRRWFRSHGDAVQGRQLHAPVRRALRERLSEGFLGDGVEVASHAGWVTAEQQGRHRQEARAVHVGAHRRQGHHDGRKPRAAGPYQDRRDLRQSSLCGRLCAPQFRTVPQHGVGSGRWKAERQPSGAHGVQDRTGFAGLQHRVQGDQREGSGQAEPEARPRTGVLEAVPRRVRAGQGRAGADVTSQ